ncbi:MAG: hypothetical protein ACTSR8_12395 [Promethearchaeota archaeon]
MALEDKKDQKKQKRNILEEEGSTRAVLSGGFFFIFAIIGALLLWVYTVIATGNEGLAYYGTIGVTVGMFSVLGTGFGQSFLARVKKAYIENGPEEAIKEASSYTKIYIAVGFLIGIVIFVMALFIEDPFLKLILYMSIIPVAMGYAFGTLGGMLNVKNRFDITAFIGSFYGVVVFIVGGILLLVRSEPVFFTIIPICISLNSLLLYTFFFKRVSEFKISELYTKGTLYSKESKEFLKYSMHSTLTNLESIGLLGNLIVFLTIFFLYFWYPNVQLLAAQILTVVMTYAIVKVAIIFFASPLNVEIAEAISKENHKVVQETITDIGRFAFLIGLTLMVLVCSASGHILRVLHLELFLTDKGEINEDLLIASQITLILCAIGQALYGFAALFGNALIGSGHAKNSGIVFGVTLLITFALTPITIFYFGYIGAGLTMLITGLFALPYMLFEVKRLLKVKLNFRIWNLIPVLTIVFLLIFFYPLDIVLEHISQANNYPIAFIGLLMFLGIIFTFIMGIPFFGVMRPGDGKMLRDIGQSIPILEKIFNFLLKLGAFSYSLNPFHKRKKRN